MALSGAIGGQGAGAGITRYLRREVTELLNGTRAIQEEKYDYRVALASLNELGSVASGINASLQKLQERFEMLKFLLGDTEEVAVKGFIKPALCYCSGTCADLQTSLSHCGACDTACKNGALCVAGTCTLYCKTGLTACNGACVNLKTDAKNCGKCGTACPGGVACGGGACGYASCAKVLAANPSAKSGVYTIKPGSKSFSAYCDMTTSPGGWTLLGTQVAGMSSSICTAYWTSGAPGRYTPTPMPGSNSGTTTRFPFSEWNALAATNSKGAYKVTSSYKNSYVAYWKASCKITNWDKGTTACYQDFTDYACTKARRKSTYNSSHGVLQGYGGQSGYSDAQLSYTTFQTCGNTPAVGYHNGSGKYVSYKHNSGLMVWFR